MSTEFLDHQSDRQMSRLLIRYSRAVSAVQVNDTEKARRELLKVAREVKEKFPESFTASALDEKFFANLKDPYANPL